MYRVVVAGAGFGGLATVAALRRHLDPEVQVILVDRRDDFVMGLRKTWAVLGTSSLDDGRRWLSDVAGVDFLQGEIERIEPEKRSLYVDGREIAGDALVVALGARQATEKVPGLADHGINVWDQGQVERARQAVASLTRGRLVAGIFGMPYACPPAPFELALLARERLPAAVEVTVFSPAPIALPVVGPVESAKVERLLTERSIEFLPDHQAVGVDQRTIRFADGTDLPFDVLLAVPQHACPDVVIDAGLAQPGGWIKPDPRTLETAYDGVYAIGDCTVVPLASGLALPKAGIFAELEAEVVAARIASRLADDTPTASFTGEAYCFLETGAGRAARASGAFLADPVAVTISEPTSQGFHDKIEFERSRLHNWFGR